MFSREGARGVVVADLLTEEAHAVAAGIGAAGGHALSVRLDVTRAQDWPRRSMPPGPGSAGSMC